MRILPSFHLESPDYTMTMDLGNNTYTIRMNWNTRSERWHMDIYDNLGGAINGIKVVEYWPLTKNHRSQIAMDGDIVVMRAVEYPKPLAYDSFNSDYNLVYLTSDEITELEAQ